MANDAGPISSLIWLSQRGLVCFVRAVENLSLTSKPPIGLRLAMWSGPRNVSTAFMRSWGNRDDTYVCDEPLYAHYLLKTGRPHPMAAEVIASQENDWRKVTAWLTGPIPEGKSVFFQKHMAHHLLPEIGRDWLLRLTHLFLIRHPREVVPSLDEKFHEARLPDTGYPQQVEIFNLIREQTGTMGELASVISLDGRLIGSGQTGPMTTRLSELFRQLTRKEGVQVVDLGGRRIKKRRRD